MKFCILMSLQLYQKKGAVTLPNMKKITLQNGILKRRGGVSVKPCSITEKATLTEPYKLANFTSQSSALVPQFYNVFIMTENDLQLKVDGNEDILNDLMLPVQTMILKINNSQLILIW